MTITEVAISWTFLNKQVSTSQVLRVTNAFGNEFGLEEQSKRILAPPVKQDAVYAMVDVSMILSRQGWKETKLGRCLSPLTAYRMDQL